MAGKLSQALQLCFDEDLPAEEEEQTGGVKGWSLRVTFLKMLHRGGDFPADHFKHV